MRAYEAGEVDAMIARAVAAERERLLAQQPAQPQQSPVKVGRITDNIKGMVLRQEVMLYTDDYLPIGTALYTSPPASKPWVGLTDDDIQEVRENCGVTHHAIKTIEAKLKEKNA